MPDPAETAIDIVQLAAMVKQQRQSYGLSLRDLAAETGVPYSTLARVETGKVPDLTTFRSIVAWLGVRPDRFFPTPRVRQETTPESVAYVLQGDPALSAPARDKLVGLFSEMYAALTVSATPVQLHLRAERAFTPPAGALLADLVQRMEAALLAESDA